MSLRKLAVILVTVACLVALAGCTQAKKGPISQKDFADQYKKRQGVSDEWAKCIAHQLFTANPKDLRLTQAERKAFNDTKPKESVTRDIYPKAEKAGQECGKKHIRP